MFLDVIALDVLTFAQPAAPTDCCGGSRVGPALRCRQPAQATLPRPYQPDAHAPLCDWHLTLGASMLARLVQERIDHARHPDVPADPDGDCTGAGCVLHDPDPRVDGDAVLDEHVRRMRGHCPCGNCVGDF